jgi:hypothetical protein
MTTSQDLAAQDRAHNLNNEDGGMQNFPRGFHGSNWEIARENAKAKRDELIHAFRSLGSSATKALATPQMTPIVPAANPIIILMNIFIMTYPVSFCASTTIPSGVFCTRTCPTPMMNGSISKRSSVRIGSIVVIPSLKLRSSRTSSPGTATRSGQAVTFKTCGGSPRKSPAGSNIDVHHSDVALEVDALTTDAI